MKRLTLGEQLLVVVLGIVVAGGIASRLDIPGLMSTVTFGLLGDQTAPPATIPPSAEDAAAALDALVVISERSLDGYIRDRFGPAWTDDVSVAGGHNGCDTRNDILRRDADPGTLTIKADSDGCKVLAGAWTSPYTGERITDRREVQIDHIVPLAEAWRSGAHLWDPARLKNFANDPLELHAVDSASNLAKGDSGPEDWIPQLDTCEYARDWIAVKTTYQLSVTTPEKTALRRLLATCPT